MLATITLSQQTWQSPDGQRKLFTVKYRDQQGIEHDAKTWSGKIANGTGQQFDLDVYTKDGKNGPETFVRQVQAEGSQYASSPSGGGSGAASGGEKQFKGDPDTRASIEKQTSIKTAADIVANFYNTVGIDTPEAFTLDAYTKEIVETSKTVLEYLTAVPTAIAEAFPGAEAVANDEPFPSGAQTQDSLV